MMMTYQQVKELHNRVVHNNKNHHHHNRQHNDDSNEDANTTKRATAVFYSSSDMEEVNDAITLAETDVDDDEEVVRVGEEDEQQDCYESEEETQIAQAMARAAFTRSASTPMLNLLLKAAFQEEQAKQLLEQEQEECYYWKSSKGKRTHKDTAVAMSASMMNSPRPRPSSSARSFKKARRGPRRGVSGIPTTGATGITSPVRLSASAPSLQCLNNDNNTTTTTKEVQTYGATTTTTTRTKPSDTLQSLLSQAGRTYKTYDYTTLTTMGFFIKLSSEQINMYDTDLVRAVRDQDLIGLKDRRATVPSLHAGNKFGETILHASCRRAAYPIVQFLLTDGGHPIQVCCDYGRTVLHDAAWTCTPNFAIIDMLLDVCPDLLYVCDRRGYTALDYIPKDQYEPWCEYLTARTASLLRPTLLH